VPKVKGTDAPIDDFKAFFGGLATLETGNEIVFTQVHTPCTTHRRDAHEKTNTEHHEIRNIMHACSAYIYVHTHKHTHARTHSHTHTHTHTHTPGGLETECEGVRTHTHTHTLTHTRTHIHSHTHTHTHTRWARN
jgi:hypothetical protein